MRGRKRDDVALKSRGSQVKAEAVAPAKSMTNEMFNLRLRENQKKKNLKRNRSKVKLIKHVKCQEKKFHSLLYFLC